MHRLLAALVLVAGIAAGEPLRVACGTTVLWDMARNIGGDRVQAVPLVAPGVDPHVFQPTAAEARALAGARLVIVNGLGFEGWFAKLAADAGFAGTVAVASRGIAPRMLCDGDHAGHHHHEHGAEDPHAWLDLANGIRYAENIRDALIAADAAGADDYRAWGDAYLARLRALDAWTKRQIAQIPPARRILVTNHDAAGYFAAAYGFTVRAPATAVEDAQPGAQAMADLAAWIRAQQVPAVFLESAKSPRLVERLAEEAGVRLGGELHLDGIPAAGPSSYEGMFLLNVRRIVAALR